MQLPCPAPLPLLLCSLTPAGRPPAALLPRFQRASQPALASVGHQATRPTPPACRNMANLGLAASLPSKLRLLSELTILNLADNR